MQGKPFFLSYCILQKGYLILDTLYLWLVCKNPSPRQTLQRQKQDRKLRVPLHYCAEGLALQCFFVTGALPQTKKNELNKWKIHFYEMKEM